MKRLLCLLFLPLAVSSFGQTVISSVNSGGQSSNTMISSVGEIYVVPTTDPDEANSGLMGALSRIEFFVTGVNNTLSSDDTRAYPNPTSDALFFETSNASLNLVYIYDTNGRLVTTLQLTGNRVDVSDLTTGVYFVRTNIESIPAFKIIKQ